MAVVLTVGRSPAAGFSFVHPGGATAPEPVLIEDDVPRAFTNSIDRIGSLVSREAPPPHLLQTFRKLGVRCYVRYGYHEGVEPEFVRRACGFLAFVQEADGVFLEDYGKFPEAWRRAVEEAKEDVAAAEKLKALGTNRIGWWFEAVDFARIDCDLLRRKCLEYAAAGDVPDLLPPEPHLDDPDLCELPTQTVSVVFRTTEDLERTRLKLKRRDGADVVYDLLVDTAPVHEGPRAPSLVTDKLMVTMGSRFRPYERGYAIRQNRVRFDPQYRTFSPAYPRPECDVRIRTQADGTREVTVSATVKEKRPPEVSDGFEVKMEAPGLQLEDDDL